MNVTVAYSEGRGSFASTGDTESGRARGAVESTLTGVYPYLRLRPNRRISLWGLAGIGEGDLSLTEDGGRSLRLGARWTVAAAVTLGLVGSRDDGTGAAPEHALVLRAAARW